MHVVNTTTNVIHPHVELDGYAYGTDTPVTFAGVFVTFNGTISLAPGSPDMGTTSSVSSACPVQRENGQMPNFFLLTTHTYKQGTHTFIKDGEVISGTTKFESTDWEKPGTAELERPSFLQFSTETLSNGCDYSNPNHYTIIAGDDPATDEECLAIGFYFPANPSAPATSASPRHNLLIDGRSERLSAQIEN